MIFFGSKVLNGVIRRATASCQQAKPIVNRAKNNERAVALLWQLNEKIETLAINPYMGRKRDELLYHLRSFPCGNYIIFYLPIASGIDVIRVLHGAQDIEKIFSVEGLPEY